MATAGRVGGGASAFFYGPAKTPTFLLIQKERIPPPPAVQLESSC